MKARPIQILSALFATVLLLGGSYGHAAAAAANPLTELKKNGPEAAKKCNAAEDEDIKKAKAKSEELKENQSGDKSSDPMRACQKMEGVAKSANSALTKFKTKCQPEVKKCQENIKQLGATRLDAAATKAKEQCDKAEEELKKAENEVKMNNARAEDSSKCQNDIGGGQMPQMPEPEKEEAAATPTPAPESQDCSNPKVASANPVCVCAANPFASVCKPAAASIEDLVSDNGQAVDNSYVGGPGPGSSLEESRARQASALGQFKGGAGGGNAGVNASTKAAGAGAGSGAASPLIKVPTGGGGGGRGGGAAGGGKGALEGGGYAGGRPREGLEDSPDLKKFLPQGRGPANGIGVDGITGPHTNLFLKVRVRYQAKASSLNMPAGKAP